MNFSNYRLSLDIHETESGLSLRAKKGDSIRKIYVTLMDGGVPYRITPDCTAAFTARKPDNTIIFNDAVIENNAIVYELTPQTTAAAGQVRCEVRLYGGDGRLITSPRFFLDVDDTVFTEGDQVVSEDEYTILEDAIDAVNKAVAEAQAAVDRIAADFQEKVDSGQFTDVVSSAFLHKTGGAMSGDIAMDGHRVTGLGTPAAEGDAVPKAYADAIGNTANSAKQTAENALPKAGGTMTGNIAMSGKKITGLGTPTAAADAVTKSYADAIKETAEAAKNALGLGSASGALQVGNGGTGATTAEGAQSNLQIPALIRSMVSADLLWENASPTSSFEGQVLTVSSLQDYDLVFVLCRLDREYDQIITGLFPDTSAYYELGYVENTASSKLRRILDFYGTSVDIGSCFRFPEGTKDNSCMIPTKIYGLKLGG